MENKPQKYQSPFSLFDELSEMNWPLNIPASFTQGNQGLSIYEDEKSVTIEAALPGLTEDDFEIIYENGELLIRGEKKESEDDKKRRYMRRMSSSFMYHLTVPTNVDERQDPVAEFTNGIVKVRFQKQQKAQAKRISIQKAS